MEIDTQPSVALEPARVDGLPFNFSIAQCMPTKQATAPPVFQRLGAAEGSSFDFLLSGL